MEFLAALKVSSQLVQFPAMSYHSTKTQNNVDVNLASHVHYPLVVEIEAEVKRFSAESKTPVGISSRIAISKHTHKHR